MLKDFFLRFLSCLVFSMFFCCADISVAAEINDKGTLDLNTKFSERTYTVDGIDYVYTVPEAVHTGADGNPVYYEYSVSDYYGGINTTTSAGVVEGNAIKNAVNETLSINNTVISNNTINITSARNDNIGIGAGLFNSGTIGDLNADFTGNSVNVNGYDHGTIYASGGAVYNSGSIKNISGNYIENKASVINGHNYATVSAGAISNTESGVIEKISGGFYGNTVFSNAAASSLSRGGAIYNMGKINEISDTVFVENKAESGAVAFGGAVLNEQNASIDKLNAGFYYNSVEVKDSVYVSAHGGALYNAGSINELKSVFVGNYAKSTSTSSKNNFEPFGGAVANAGKGVINNIDSVFIDNKVIASGNMNQTNSRGGAIFNAKHSDDIVNIGTLKGYFENNSVNANNSRGWSVGHGGAIYNEGKIGEIKDSYFKNNSITSQTVDNLGSAEGGAIYNAGTTKIANTVFEGNSSYSENNSDEAHAYGGAINNIGELTITNSSFINNKAESKTNTGTNITKGGAIHSTEDLTVRADNGVTLFSGNKAVSNGVESSNAIYMDSPSVVLNFESVNNGLIQSDDAIDGEKGYGFMLNGDSTGKIILNNDVKNANISLDNTNLYLGKDTVFNESESLTLNSGFLSMQNETTGTMHVPSFTLNGNTNFAADVDLANKKMDRITADNYSINNNAMLHVNYLNLLSDSSGDTTTILFADKELANNVQYTGINPVAYSPIYKYNVSYGTNPEDNLGYFVFSRGSSSSNSSDNFNPSVLPAPVAQQAGAYTTQLQTFNYAFQHADTFMSIPYLERVAIKNSNKYALSPTGDATDVGTFSPLMTKHSHSGFWVKPYASFESVPLKNGPKVSNINYGTLIGYDSDVKELSRGFDRVITGYIGYNGASQRYSGVDTYQNGGILGGTTTFYKGNFFNATTLSVGASAGNSNGMYGSENYSMLLAGVGNKTGYNFELKEGLFIIQPSMLISYTFVNTFDYTNAAGLKIKSDPLNAIQLAPGIKLIANTKNGWQPYIGVSMVWNLLDKAKVTADDVRLPEMSIKPYVQYGVGVQKCLKEDKMTAFAQAMIHNGGRNGISLSAGMRWKVGKE